jgi:hypothetical protein
MEAKAEFLKAVAVRGALEALWLNALRLYLALSISVMRRMPQPVTRLHGRLKALQDRRQTSTA